MALTPRRPQGFRREPEPPGRWRIKIKYDFPSAENQTQKKGSHDAWASTGAADLAHKDCGVQNGQKQWRRAIYVLYVQSEGHNHRDKHRK